MIASLTDGRERSAQVEERQIFVYVIQNKREAMDIKSILDGLELSPHNAVVIGSGIMNALRIRASKDVDLLVAGGEWQRLKSGTNFEKAQMHGQPMLKAGNVEISGAWNVLGRTYTSADFEEESVVIDAVRYITLEFLLRAKKDWVEQGVAREKDKRDIRLIDDYLAKGRMTTR